MMLDEDEEDISISAHDLTEIFILSTIALIGISGNLLVFLVYWRRKGQQTNAALYILNLAAGKLQTYS